MKITKPRFRLSSLLLIVAIVALVSGWYAEKYTSDRRFRTLESETEERLDCIWGGVHTEAETRRIINTSREFKKRQPDADFFRYLQNELIWAMFDLWRDEEAVDLAWDHESNAAASLGNEILRILDCDSVDKFISMVTKFDGFDPNGNNTELFLNIHDKSRNGLGSFREFVQRSLIAKK